MSGSRRRLTAVVLTALVVGASALSISADAQGARRPVRYFDRVGESSNFVLLPQRWETTALTYGFMNRTPDLSPALVDSTIASAFAEWARVANLTFTAVPDCGAPIGDPSCQTPQIRLLFAAGAHGDDAPFDGPNGVLAHAVSPGPGIGGDVHFDEAEDWTANDLFVVALHELGHSLGLDHTQSSNCPAPSGRFALMCPVYVDQTGLEPDDIAGIQALYGARTEGLTVSVAGRGLVMSSPSGISCPPTCSNPFSDQTTVVLQAQRTRARWVFKGWGGACAFAGTASTCTLTTDGVQSVSATFKKRRR